MKAAQKGKAPARGTKSVADDLTAPQRGSGKTKADVEWDSAPNAKQFNNRSAQTAWQAISHKLDAPIPSTKRQQVQAESRIRQRADRYAAKKTSASLNRLQSQ